MTYLRVKHRLILMLASRCVKREEEGKGTASEHSTLTIIAWSLGSLYPTQRNILLHPDHAQLTRRRQARSSSHPGRRLTLLTKAAHIHQTAGSLIKCRKRKWNEHGTFLNF